MRRPRSVRDGSRGSYRSSWNRRRNATRRLEAVLEDPRPCEDRPQEEADRRPVEFGDEAEPVLMPDVAACEAPPISLPPGREAILRSTKIGVVSLELLPHLRERIEIRDPGDPDARLSGPDTFHPPFRPNVSGRDPERHFPWKAGFRFSRNARKPSFASAIAKRRFCNSRSRAKPSYIGISRPSVTDRLMKPTARAACCGYAKPFAKAIVSSQNFARGKTRLNRPHSSASFGVIMRPVASRLMSAPADQTPSSFEAMTHTSTSSSNRTSSIIVFRSRIKSAS